MLAITTTNQPIPARVRSGIGLLDRRLPDWAWLVSADRLPHQPILEQLYGDSIAGCAVLGLDPAGEIAHGFWPDPADHATSQDASAKLAGYWQVAVAARRAGGDR